MPSSGELKTRESAAQADPGVGALRGQQPLSLTDPCFLKRGGPGSRAGKNMEAGEGLGTNGS